MTVGELIEELEAYDSDRRVYVDDDGRPMNPYVHERGGKVMI